MIIKTREIQRTIRLVDPLPCGMWDDVTDAGTCSRDAHRGMCIYMGDGVWEITPLCEVHLLKAGNNGDKETES